VNNKNSEVALVHGDLGIASIIVRQGGKTVKESTICIAFCAIGQTVCRIEYC